MSRNPTSKSGESGLTLVRYAHSRLKARKGKITNYEIRIEYFILNLQFSILNYLFTDQLQTGLGLGLGFGLGILPIT